jgi:hypothetical protein
MFGRGIEIQNDSCAMRERVYIMLLQLTHDDLMHWSFGDTGVYQFWISPADLDQHRRSSDVKRAWAGIAQGRAQGVQHCPNAAMGPPPLMISARLSAAAAARRGGSGTRDKDPLHVPMLRLLLQSRSGRH